MGEIKMTYELLSADNPVFSCYVTWGCLLLLKLLFMGPATGMMRMQNKAFENPEDAPKGVEAGEKNAKVERIRRAHLNDIENILPFMIVALLYTLTNPNVILAMMLIRVAALSRFCHTIVYAVYPVRQPARAICYFVMFLITCFMAIYCVVCYHGF